MNSSDSIPKLPWWAFLATDLVLIGAAVVIAAGSARPLSNNAILGIVACVVLGAVIALFPLVARYERAKNQVLDERQVALEGLASVVASSAEQVSIAANGLHQIAELASKNVRLAEHLPHKLQEKMAEFQAVLASSADVEKEELERELLALRTSESERLESVSQRIAALSAEWSKLEAATHQHLLSANEAVAQLALGTANALAQARAGARHGSGPAHMAAAIDEAQSGRSAAGSFDATRSGSPVDLDATVTAAVSSIVDRVVHELDDRLTHLTGGNFPASSAPAHVPAVAPSERFSRRENASGEGNVDDTPTAEAAPNAEAAVVAPVKRARRVRREDPPSAASEPNAPDVTASSIPNESATMVTGASEAPVHDSIAPEEPPPIPPDRFVEIAPIAPDTPEPFSHYISSSPFANSLDRNVATGDVDAPAETVKPRGRRAAQLAENESDPMLGFESEETPGGPASGVSESVLTSDGATRLHVTSYIGIGNRLYIRGTGPGLTWEKGAPLQFVSIGKWRWETNDASAPVQFKLYKNDDVECSALGVQSLEPGHQQEITAVF